MSYQNTEIVNMFENMLLGLSDKETSVITRRIGWNGDKETLQAIGDSFGITRERVRQIEDVGIKKIGRIIRSSKLFEFHALAEKILAFHGGLLIRDKLVSAIIVESQIDGEINEGIIDIIIQANFNIQKSKPQLGTRTFFLLPQIQKRCIQDIHKEALRFLSKRGDIIEQSALYETIKANLAPQYGKIENVLIDAVMDVFEDVIKGEDIFIGLTKWKILNPSTLKDKAIYVLKKQRRPMHFIELSNVISETFNESVKMATVHNELIRNSEFVLIGRGIYVLKDWGYKSGTVLDVIIDIFQKAKAPLSTDDIIEKVLKSRQVKVSTIYMNLQNKSVIERVGRNMYQLKGE